MNLTIKEAYEAAKEAYEDFRITTCYELEDCWIFIAPCTKEGNPTFIPPLKILKSGEDIDFWEKRFMNCFERGDWLKANGKNISIEEIERMTD